MLGTRASPALSIAPPRVSGVELAPNVAALQRSAWNAGAWPSVPIRTIEIEDVLLLPRGLVQRSDASIVESTAKHLPGAVVEQAVRDFTKSWRTASVLRQPILLGVRPGHTCYGHAITEIIGSAWAGASALQGREFSLLISSPPGLLSAYREAAKAAGLTSAPLINHHSIRPLRLRTVYLVDGFAQTDSYISPLLTEFAQVVRRRCDCAGAAEQRKKLYVARSAAGGRAVANEAEVWRLLESRGFELVRPETLNWPDQVRLFWQASHIVGPMGSALANATFCSPGAKLLTLAPAGILDTFFWRLAACMDLDYAEVRCEDVPCSKYEVTGRYLDRDILVNPALISTWLDGVGA